MKIGSVPRTSTPGLALALALVATGWAPAARAQEAEGDEAGQATPTQARGAAAARALFGDGVACADRQDWACAADRFGRAHALRSSPVIAYNYGHALVQLGRLVEGAEMLRQATREGSPQVRADAERLVAALEPRLGRLTLRVEGPLERATIRIGETEIPAELHGMAQPIDPGEHTITATRDGAVVATASVTIAEGASAEARLTIPELPPEPASPDPARATERIVERVIVETPGRSSDDGIWIGLGIGAGALVIAGAVVLGVVLAQPQDLQPFMGNLDPIEIGR